MNCPYCDQPMTHGKLYAADGHGIYWLPTHTDLYSIKGILQKKKIIAVGGVVLDQLYPIGFFAKDRPDSFYCKACNVFVTKCDSEK